MRTLGHYWQFIFWQTAVLTCNVHLQREHTLMVSQEEHSCITQSPDWESLEQHPTASGLRRQVLILLERVSSYCQKQWEKHPECHRGGGSRDFAWTQKRIVSGLGEQSFGTGSCRWMAGGPTEGEWTGEGVCRAGRDRGAWGVPEVDMEPGLASLSWCVRQRAEDWRSDRWDHREGCEMQSRCYPGLLCNRQFSY